MNLLFISNDKQSFRKASSFFLKVNYHCNINDGEDILEVINEQNPNVIIIDLILEKTTGIILCRKIRSQKKYQYIPIILMSQDMSEKNVMVGLTSGANEFISKPISFIELKLRLEHLYELFSSKLRQKKILEKVEYSVEEKEKIIKVLAHDLRSPLSGIAGLANLIGNMELPLSETRTLVKKIEESADDLLKMITDVLESRELLLPLKFSKIDLSILLKKTIDLLKFDANSKKITLNFISTEVSLMVNGVEVQLMRMIQNLINNAIKYTKIGGKINVSTKSENNKALIIIEDNGLGINLKTLKNIRKGKRTQRNSGTLNEKSFGIGLQIVQAILNDHNGTFQIESEFNKGTTATISLPFTLE